jgi:hypothetical protein
MCSGMNKLPTSLVLLPDRKQGGETGGGLLMITEGSKIVI